MDQEKLIERLAQIEEQAQLSLSESPKLLLRERQRMIVALVRSIRLEIKASRQGATALDEFDPERTLEGRKH